MHFTKPKWHCSMHTFCSDFKTDGMCWVWWSVCTDITKQYLTTYHRVQSYICRLFRYSYSCDKGLRNKNLIQRYDEVIWERTSWGYTYLSSGKDKIKIILLIKKTVVKMIAFCWLQIKILCICGLGYAMINISIRWHIIQDLPITTANFSITMNNFDLCILLW